jgi:hypothetical protein
MKRMKRIFLLVCLILPVHAFAQDAPKPAASPEPVSPAAPVVEKSAKPKPVILEKEKLTELTLLRLQMENAQLKADAAIPADLKANIKAAGDAIAEFWKTVGINPAELSTKWQASNGVNGAIILKPVEVEQPKTEAKPEAKKN